MAETSSPEFGVILPNHGVAPSYTEVDEFAHAAEELGFDSVWATEHVIVGPDAPDYYRQVLEPLSCLAWLAGRLPTVALGTSIVLLPLHHPMYLAKQAATIQQLSGGRLRLGIGVGWHEQEYAFMGRGFHDRGARADESLRLLRALWSGDRDFTGRYWSFHDAYFGPLPEVAPQIWIGGNSEAAQQRARAHGDVWHPIAPESSAVNELKQAWPAGRVVPRIHVRFGTDSEDGTTTAQAVEAQLRELLAAGADGMVLSVTGSPSGELTALRRLARDVLPALRP